MTPLQKAAHRLVKAGVDTESAVSTVVKLESRGLISFEDDELVIPSESVALVAAIAPQLVDLSTLPARSEQDRAIRAYVRERQAVPPTLKRGNAADARSRLAALPPLSPFADDTARCTRAMQRERLMREIENSDDGPEAAE